MTNTPGEGQTPSDDNQSAEQPIQEQPGQEQPGYWEQQEAQQPPQPTGYGYPPQPPQYGYPQQGMPPMQYAPDHPQATTALVLGIVGIVVCGGLLSPVAWWMGKKAVDEIDASQGAVGGRGAAQAGFILGIIGTCFLALGILFFGGMLLVLTIGAVTTTATY